MLIAVAMQGAGARAQERVSEIAWSHWYQNENLLK